jgi:hypothetical protein
VSRKSAAGIGFFAVEDEVSRQCASHYRCQTPDALSPRGASHDLQSIRSIHLKVDIVAFLDPELSR